MKLTKWVFAPPILLWLFAAQAESTASATLLELHRQDCQFSWPDPTPIAIVESTRDDISKSVVRFTFAVDLGSNSIDSKGRFLFTCFRKANEKQCCRAGLNDRRHASEFNRPSKLLQARMRVEDISGTLLGNGELLVSIGRVELHIQTICLGMVKRVAQTTFWCVIPACLRLVLGLRATLTIASLLIR